GHAAGGPHAAVHPMGSPRVPIGVVTAWWGRAGTRQARWLGTPSMVTRQSKQAPTPQNRPRGAPLTRVVRQDRTPAAHSAAATLCPGAAVTGRPSKWIANPRVVIPQFWRNCGVVARGDRSFGENAAPAQQRVARAGARVAHAGGGIRRIGRAQTGSGPAPDRRR